MLGESYRRLVRGMIGHDTAKLSIQRLGSLAYQRAVESMRTGCYMSCHQDLPPTIHHLVSITHHLLPTTYNRSNVRQRRQVRSDLVTYSCCFICGSALS